MRDMLRVTLITTTRVGRHPQQSRKPFTHYDVLQFYHLLFLVLAELQIHTSHETNCIHLRLMETEAPFSPTADGSAVSVPPDKLVPKKQGKGKFETWIKTDKGMVPAHEHKANVAKQVEEAKAKIKKRKNERKRLKQRTKERRQRKERRGGTRDCFWTSCLWLISSGCR